MKKIIMIVAAVSFFTACMKDSPNYQLNGTFVDSFEYSNAADIFKEDAEQNLHTDYFLFFPAKDQAGNPTGGVLPVSYIEYYNKYINQTLYGGFVLSRQTWERTAEQGGTDPEKPQSAGTTEAPEIPGEYSAYGKLPKIAGAPENKTFLYFWDSGRTNMTAHDIFFNATSAGSFTVMKIDVNNSASTVLAITGRDGNEFNLTGDYTLTATGYLGGQKTGSADFLLAGKGRGKVPGTDSLVTSWKSFDLSKLGSIEYIDFSLNTPEGVDMKKTVCLDNFAGNISVSY